MPDWDNLTVQTSGCKNIRGEAKFVRRAHASALLAVLTAAW